MKRYIGLLLVVSVLRFSVNAQDSRQSDLRVANEQLATLLQMIHFAYVDTVSLAPLVEKSAIEMLKQLDPHSAYIPARDVDRANEQLQGNFDGIGVSFQIVKDTITVVEAIADGPSEKLGIQGGDKIVVIDGINCTGDSANQDFVFRHLRGKKGTIVTVRIIRAGVAQPMDFKIVRDKIPIYSVETYFMENNHVGYVMIDRFSRNTGEEFRKALIDLKSQGATSLILDLRGNGGGYMDQAVVLVSEFLPKGKMVVYMEGKAQPRQNSLSEGGGVFEKGKVLVMIDEGSASASEIVSGALQDNDRAIIMGRRSFGKGLVQRPLKTPDGSEVRLTIARYYTPSGRFIQKPYNDGLQNYYSDIMNRYRHGEMLHPDSVQLPDSLKYHTTQNRTVYGGGGIMPDVFTPIDTNKISDYYVDLRRTGVLNNFVMDFLNTDRTKLLKQYPDFQAFNKGFTIDATLQQRFETFSDKAGVKRNHVRKSNAEQLMSKLFDEMKKDTTLNDAKTYSDYVSKALWDESKMKQYLQDLSVKEDQEQARLQKTSDEYILLQLKALIARNLYGYKYYFQTIKSIDNAYQQAVQTIENDRLFKQNKITY
ncbi:peptidase S41 [Bacteroidia bacterium]|nr:peptidase S41 [Bacteroidia bacterium]